MSGLPDLPPGLPAGLEKYLRKLGQQFEVSQADRGSPLMSKPTFKDLIDVGLLHASQSESLKSNGKTFTLDSAANWLTPTVSRWYTSLLDPPTPSGLAVGLNASNIVLVWNAWASEYYLQTRVYRAATNDLTAAAQIGSTTGNTYVDNLPPDGTVYYYWIRHEAKGGKLSDFNQVSGTTTGNVPSAPVVSYAFDGTDLVLTWPTPTSQLTIKYYIVRYGVDPSGPVLGLGADFEGGIEVYRSNANTARLTAYFGGTRRYWVAAVDVNDNLGLPGYVDVAAVVPNAPVVLQSVQNGSLVLTFTAAQGTLPVASFEVRYGASWAAGTSVSSGAQTRFETAVNWTGSRTFWLTAYDSAGNPSAATQSVFSPAFPGSVAVAYQVIDNNVLLTWTTPTASLPIDYYTVDRGGAPIGTVYAKFSAIFETASGTYVYGITPVDTAGNVGTRSTTTVVVAQPPDFILYNVSQSVFGGTKTDVAVDAATGWLVCSINTTSESWATHFSSRSWNSPADQIAAGYTQYLVGKTSGSYTEVIDYGATIPACKATMSATIAYLAGAAVTISPTIEFSPDNSTWSTPVAAYEAYGTSFRYVRYKLSFSASHDGSGGSTDTSALVGIFPLTFRLDVKERSHQGVVTANSGDAGGTSVDITGIFADVTSIEVSPLGTTAVIVVYDFVDAANPTSFKVLAFNTSGTRVTATVSYDLRGV